MEESGRRGQRSCVPQVCAQIEGRSAARDVVIENGTGPFFRRAGLFRHW